MTKSKVSGGPQIPAGGVKSSGAARNAQPRSHGPWSPVESFRQTVAAGLTAVARARNNLALEAVDQANQNFGDH